MHELLHHKLKVEDETIAFIKFLSLQTGLHTIYPTNNLDCWLIVVQKDKKQALEQFVDKKLSKIFNNIPDLSPLLHPSF